MEALHKLKEGVDEIKNSFENFKTENDKRLKLLETKGHVPGDIEEKMDKHGDAIDDLVKKLNETQAAMNRGGTPTKEDEENQVKARVQSIINRYMRKGVTDLADLKFYNEKQVEGYFKDADYRDAVKALSVGSDPDGGYTVRPEISDLIIKKLFESSPMRQICGSISISTDSYEELADYDEPGSSWVGETGSRSVTTSNVLNKLIIPVHELYANPQATQKLLDDSSVDIESWHAGKVAEKFARDEATAFVTGSGVSKPRGFTTFSHGTSYGTIEQSPVAVAGAIAADDLLDLQYLLFEGYQKNAVWLMARATAKAIRKLKDGEGRYLWSMEGNLNGGFQMELLGRPLYWASDMAAIASSALAVAYGDFKQGYLIVDRIGIRLLRDPFSNKPYVQFYTTKRVGGNPHNYQAIKLMKLATSVS